MEEETFELRLVGSFGVCQEKGQGNSRQGGQCQQLRGGQGRGGGMSAADHEEP